MKEEAPVQNFEEEEEEEEASFLASPCREIVGAGRLRGA